MLRFAAALTSLVGVLTVTASAAAAAFPGQNGPIAFQRLGEIVLVNPDGTGERVISQGSANRDPALSPDGSLVAYESGRDLVVTATDGSGTRNVTTGGRNDQFPAFAPDGRRIVFVRADDGDLYTVNVDGTGLTRLTTDGPSGDESEPEWSPDGSRIAFQRAGCDQPQGGQVCVFTIRADGTGLTNLTPEEYPPACPNVNPGVGPRGNSAEPSWSPDGTKIAFRGTAFHCDNAGGMIAGGDIWVMNADGSGKIDITPDANDGSYDAQPSWSPDGQWIAFQSDRLNGGNNGPVDILVMPAAGLAAGSPRRVVSVGSGADPQPNWAPKPPGIFGTAGPDLLNGTPGNDLIKGLAGNDVLNGLQGNDKLDGGDGNDKLTGSEGADTLLGGAGKDNLAGGTGNDSLDGGRGNDKIDGGQGRNRYTGGPGNDTINSANGKREIVACGPGKDAARADRADRLKGCEKVKRTR